MQLAGHLMDLDALPHQDLEHPRNRLGVRLAGGNDERLRFVRSSATDLPCRSCRSFRRYRGRNFAAISSRRAARRSSRYWRCRGRATRRRAMDLDNLLRASADRASRGCFGFVRGLRSVTVTGVIRPRAGRLGQDADRVVKVRRRAKAAVPPGVVGRICRDAGDVMLPRDRPPSCSRSIPTSRRIDGVDARVRRVEKRRDDESRGVLVPAGERRRRSAETIAAKTAS